MQTCLPTKKFQDDWILHSGCIMKDGISIDIGDVETSVGKGQQKTNYLNRF